MTRLGRVEVGELVSANTVTSPTWNSCFPYVRPFFLNTEKEKTIISEGCLSGVLNSRSSDLNRTWTRGTGPLAGSCELLRERLGGSGAGLRYQPSPKRQEASLAGAGAA